MGELYSVDDMSLLRAIRGTEDPQYEKTLPAVLVEVVIDSNEFQIIQQNEHLRGLLKTFLEKNVAVERAKLRLSKMGSMGWIKRWHARAAKEDLESQIKTLEAERDAAFKPYEMLRKLTDNQNSLLKRYPA
jgi:hypothetical protein